MAECNDYEGLRINPTPSSIGNQYAGVSTDEKPANAPTYSVYLELDTGKFYYYDGTEWTEVPCCGSGGGGGGGADGVKTAKVTFTVNNTGDGYANLNGGVSELSDGFVFLSEHGVRTMMGAAAGNTVELTAILTEVGGEYGARYSVRGSNPVVTGDCELSALDPVIVVTVTGDCTITVDPAQR